MSAANQCHAGLPEGFIHALLTPYDADGRFDEATFADLVDFHLREGAAGLSVALHYGESPSQTLDERKRSAEIAVERAAGRVPVYIHTAHARGETQIELARHADSIGADGVTAPPPYARRLSEPEIIAHYERIAAVFGGQVMAYNVIAPAAMPLIAPTIAELARRIPRFVGVKNARVNIPYVNSIIQAVADFRPEVVMVNGSELFVPMFALGVRTIHSLMSCVAPRTVRRLWLACAEGRYDDAQQAQVEVLNLLRLLMPAYPAQIKIGMSLVGRGVGGIRAPHRAAPAETVNRIEKTLERLGIFDTEPQGWNA